MKTITLTLALALQMSCAYAQQQPAEFPAAASAFLAQELPIMEAAVVEKDQSYFMPALERMKAFLGEWGANSPQGSVTLETYSACTDAVTDFLISGLCRISPPGSICEPSTFLPRVEANIRKCGELARANPAVQGTLRDKAAQRRLALRVCRAWHVTMSVQVRQPGLCRAEG